jgi:RNA polymerase sigma factor (TIGR02999 family)
VSQQSDDVTRILAELRDGDPAAANRLLPVIYDELHGIAQRVFSTCRTARNSIQPTILVHDVFMKLSKNTKVEWNSRAHFFAVAAAAARDLLVDYARREKADKRGGQWNRVSLTGLGSNSNHDKIIDVIDLEDSLKRLGELAPRQEKIVEMRFYGGLTVEEVAQVLNVSQRTVVYEWRAARAWLRSRLED